MLLDVDVSDLVCACQTVNTGKAANIAGCLYLQSLRSAVPTVAIQERPDTLGHARQWCSKSLQLLSCRETTQVHQTLAEPRALAEGGDDMPQGARLQGFHLASGFQFQIDLHLHPLGSSSAHVTLSGRFLCYACSHHGGHGTLSASLLPWVPDCKCTPSYDPACCWLLLGRI